MENHFILEDPIAKIYLRDLNAERLAYNIFPYCDEIKIQENIIYKDALSLAEDIWTNFNSIGNIVLYLKKDGVNIKLVATHSNVELSLSIIAMIPCKFYADGITIDKSFYLDFILLASDNFGIYCLNNGEPFPVI